uniref:Small ribosomal subunit protein uS4c n=1 Tax=Caulerpa lentillifera TaxID=148947 RepID=A0A345HGZ6_9CHLO|nr:30S ribosomal protein S4 [Caulerpa lentillifera]AXG75886.1 30S ribosomal protein S4 [Caulerpa lentillifera]QKS32291.1 30S ribosomal protein S4 [Caulerpa lentillifera]QUV75645.1 ribosomal protein S4 [Caulerpa lentillifera]
MSRYRGPKMRILKWLGSPLPGLGVRLNQEFLKNRTKEEDKDEKKKNQKKPFRRRLKEKQKLRYHYGLTEKNLINYVRKARRQKTSTGEMLLKLLEMRLDNILFRYGYAPTIPAARQFITHGHILLNGKRNNRPSYQCKVHDIISFKKQLFKKKSSPLQKGTSESSVVKIQQEISREDVGLDINELLVIEYYSRSL